METKIIFTTIKQDFNLLNQLFGFLKEHKESNANCIRLFVSGAEAKAYFDNQELITVSFYSVGEKFIFENLKKEEYTDKFPMYSDDNIVKMAKELSAKTKLLKKFKKKWRKVYTITRLQKILDAKKTYRQDPREYEGVYGFDDDGYRRDQSKNEAEVELLQALIDSKKKKRWMYY